jgi:hypothetical protein
MAFYTAAQLRKIAQDCVQPLRKSTSGYIKESKLAASARQSFDVFLSHSILDEEIILGVKIVIEKLGFSVYVDWIEDPELDRKKVNAETADRLQTRMKQCKCLIYAHSINSPDSKWMPWELGFFDGYKGHIAVLPVAETVTDVFSGQEYLGLYPYVDHLISDLWVNKGNSLTKRLRRPDEQYSFLRLTEWIRA